MKPIVYFINCITLILSTTSLAEITMRPDAVFKKLETSDGMIEHPFAGDIAYPANNFLANVSLVNLLTDQGSNQALWAFSLGSSTPIKSVETFEVSSKTPKTISTKGWYSNNHFNLQSDKQPISASTFPNAFKDGDQLLIFKFVIEFKNGKKSTLYQPWLFANTSKKYIQSLRN